MSEIRTCFKKVDYTLDNLLNYIDLGDIGLPDIQRPFVWPNAKVRDLFDSMYRGFPVGYLLFWENAGVPGAKAIGTAGKQHAPARLIVDGQQRLTSLYAVLRGKEVVDEEFKSRKIEVAFRPRDGRFEVTDAAVRKDPEFIPSISEVWASGKSSHKVTKEFLAALSAKTALSDEEEERIAHNLDRLFDLQKYPFTALEIAPTVDEEQVADIFVRINSQGAKLEQADFILTLLSVFWDGGRRELEDFCRASGLAPGPGAKASPFNHFIRPGPDLLLRVGVAVGFQRGRLKSVYQVLRGKDPETERFDEALREAQFTKLRTAQAHVLDLTSWHQFFSALVGAGFRSREQISSKNALMYAYVFYLLGRVMHRVPEATLQKLIGRWFYATSLTGRYTSSPETVMDGDLNRVKDVRSREEFTAVLDRIIEESLPGDFWKITLPSYLETSAARSPGLFAYYAAQNRLGAPILFSHKQVSHLLDPALQTKKKALDRHHLFPKKWLRMQGLKRPREINQVANSALVEWPDNIAISARAPSEYVPEIRDRIGHDVAAWNRMHDLNALPMGWENLGYDEFLKHRRVLMADVIRRGFETLK